MPMGTQVPPCGTGSGTVEVGQQASSSRSPPEPTCGGWRALARSGMGKVPSEEHSWQEGDTYSSTIRLLFTISDLAKALAPLLPI